MDKLKMSTPDLTDKNIEQIGALFPNVITETRDENGAVKKAVDFDLLKQALSKNLVEDDNERYRLDWPGKKASLLKANTPITKTLRPCREESVNFDTTENLYIEGDNFEVLKILQESYLGKIKMIYIDPPYNTGNDFIYKDNFAKSKDEYEEELGTTDEEGGKLFRNTDSNGRYHSDWLSMMYERLVVARDLLKDDGVIFISIDDNEVHNLRKTCDEVFGEENFVCNIAVKLSEATGVKMAHAKRRVPKLKEYVTVYKKADFLTIKPAMISKESWDQEYRTYCHGLTDSELNIIKEILEDEFRTSKDVELVENLLSKISFENASVVCKKTTGNEINEKWSFQNANRIVQFVTLTGNARGLARNKKNNFDQESTPTAFSIITPNNKMYIIKSDYNDETELPRCKLLFADRYLTVNSGDFWQDIKTTGLDNEGYVDFKNGKKPLKMISRCIDLVCAPNDIILDFFSGSATTAHAVMQLNAEDGGNRKFIMVQLPEPCDENSEAFKAGYKTIAEIGKERIRRAGKRLNLDSKGLQDSPDLFNSSNQDNQGNQENHGSDNLDIGFRVYKVDSTNMKDVFYHPSELKQDQLSFLESNIKEDRTPEDLLTQVILDLGLELTLPIETKKILGNTVFIVQTNALVACFDKDIDFKIVDTISDLKPLKVVFKDASFQDDKDRINVEERFKRLSPETKVTVI